MERSFGDRLRRRRRPGDDIGDCHLCGQLVGWGYSGASPSLHTERQAVGDQLKSFTVTLGTITSTLSSQISLKNGRKLRDGHHIRERCDKHQHLRVPTSVDEGDATSNYTVSLSPSGVTPTADLTVSYATSNGTATAGTDYTAKSGTLTFTRTAAGPQTFTVQTTEDAVDEGTGETFTVTVSSPSGGGGPSPTIGTASRSTTITDDDDAPSGITLSASPKHPWRGRQRHLVSR